MQNKKEENYCKYHLTFQENVFNYFSDAVFVLNLEDEILFANQKANKLLGSTFSSKIKFEKIFTLKNEDEQLITIKYLKNSVNNDINSKRHYFLNNLKNNEKYFIKFSYFTSFTQLNNEKCFLLIFKDLSESLENRNTILEQEKKYKHIFDLAPISIWEEDLTEVQKYLSFLKKTYSIKNFENFFYENPLELRELLGKIQIIDINHHTLKLFDAKTKIELIGNFDKIFTRESVEGMVKAILAILNGEKEVEHKHHVNTLAGEKRYISSKMSLSYEDENSKNLRLIICETNLTREKELLDDLTIKNNALKNAITGFMRTDSNFNILDANPAAIKLFGYNNLQDLTNQKLDRLLIFHESNLQKMIDETNSWSGEVTAINKRGAKIYCLLNFSRIKNDNNKYSGFAFSFFDISQRFLAEQTIKKYAKQTQKELRRQKEGLFKAQQIQQKMNVKKLPSSYNIDTRAYYLPCEELGGDFMDAAIKDDSFYIILADCTGHGLEASMDSVLIKSICDRHIKTLIKGETAAFIEAVNKNVCAYFKEENFLTLFCGHLDLKSNIFTYSNAGSELPFIIHSSKTTTLDKSRGLHIGFEPNYKYSSATHLLKNDEILFFYSDAIREMLLEDGEVFGIERLKPIIEQFKTNDYDFNIQYIQNEILKYSKKLPLNDDCSFFWIYKKEPLKKNYILNSLSQQEEVEKILLEELAAYGFTLPEQEQILICFSELFLNAYYHGNKKDDSKELYLNYEINFKECKFQIEDQGKGFKEKKVSNPCDIERLNNLIENDSEEDFCHGRGIFLVKYYMDEVFYNKKGNKVTVLKRRDPKNTIFHYPLQEEQSNSERQIVLDWEGEKTLKKIKYNKTSDFEINFEEQEHLSSAEIIILFKIVQNVQKNAKDLYFKTSNSTLKKRFWELGFESLGIKIL